MSNYVEAIKSKYMCTIDHHGDDSSGFDVVFKGRPIKVDIEVADKHKTHNVTMSVENNVVVTVTPKAADAIESVFTTGSSIELFNKGDIVLETLELNDGYYF